MARAAMVLASALVVGLINLARTTRLRRWALAGLTSASLLVPFTPTRATALPVAACVAVEHRALGRVCDNGDGTYGFADEQDRGSTMHLDGPTSSDVASAAPADPFCVADPTTDYHSIVIYARPPDVASRYSQQLPIIRDLVRTANGILREEALEFGAIADFKVACDNGGAITVRNEVLDTASATDTFQTIKDELKARGYTSIRRKYWVWYDGSIASNTAGIATAYDDTRRIIENYSNAGTGSAPRFAVTFGPIAPQGASVTWMHELAHTMGAVSSGSLPGASPQVPPPPQSNGAGHCIDGLDIMCYDDPSAPVQGYSDSVCTDRRHFDCRHDTYFNPDPAGGSWLATYWNLAWVQNRFIRLRATAGWNQPAIFVNESAGTVTVSATRRGIIETDRTVTYATQAGTATAGSDFTATSGSLNFAPGVRTASFQIPILADGTEEGPETFHVAMTTTDDTLVTTSSTTITIGEAVGFIQSTRTVQENVGTITIGIERTGNTASSGEVTVQASDPSQVSIPEPTVMFASGQSLASVNLVVDNDANGEPASDILLTLVNPVGVTLAADSTFELTILPSDIQPDGLIANRASGPWYGNNIYNSDARGQRVIQRAIPFQKRSYYVAVENDGPVRQLFTVRRNVTAQGTRLYALDLTTGRSVHWPMRRGYKIYLDPGEIRFIRINTWVTNEVPYRGKRSFWVSANWVGDRWMTDKVMGIIERR